jgi:hypothetical protein
MMKKPRPCTLLIRLKVSSSSSLLVVMLAATIDTLKTHELEGYFAFSNFISACHIFSTEGKLKYRAMKLGGISLRE